MGYASLSCTVPEKPLYCSYSHLTCDAWLNLTVTSRPWKREVVGEETRSVSIIHNHGKTSVAVGSPDLYTSCTLNQLSIVVDQTWPIPYQTVDSQNKKPQLIDQITPTHTSPTQCPSVPCERREVSCKGISENSISLLGQLW